MVTQSTIAAAWDRFQKTMQLLRRRQIDILERFSQKVAQKKIEDARKQIDLL